MTSASNVLARICKILIVSSARNTGMLSRYPLATTSHDRSSQRMSRSILSAFLSHCRCASYLTGQGLPPCFTLLQHKRLIWSSNVIAWRGLLALCFVRHFGPADAASLGLCACRHAPLYTLETCAVCCKPLGDLALMHAGNSVPTEGRDLPRQRLCSGA